MTSIKIHVCLEYEFIRGKKTKFSREMQMWRETGERARDGYQQLGAEVCISIMCQRPGVEMLPGVYGGVFNFS